MPDWKVSIPGVASAGPWLDPAHELQSAGGLVTSTCSFILQSFQEAWSFCVFVCVLCCVLPVESNNFFLPLILEFKKIYQYISMCEPLLINFARNM